VLDLRWHRRVGGGNSLLQSLLSYDNGSSVGELLMVAAFKDAKGYGAIALETYTRTASEIIHVTNLNDTGDGSFRQALLDSTNGIITFIVFDVAGTITLGSVITMQNIDGIYVAGQTAPGGIQFKRNSVLFSFDRDGTAHDIVFRYCRFRKDSIGTERDVIGIQGGYNIMFDHCSLAWGSDEHFAVVPITAGGTVPHHITVQRSILADALRDPPDGDGTGISLSGNSPSQSSLDNHSISIHNCVVANNTHRNPELSARKVQFVNNIVYNWFSRIGNTVEQAEIDYINNFYVQGPMSSSPWLRHSASDGPGLPSYTDTPSIYISGNHFDTDPLSPSSSPNADQWTFIRHHYTTTGAPGPFTLGAELPSGWQRGSTIEDTYADLSYPITLVSAVDARSSLVDGNVGAYRHLAANGSWTTVRDHVDQDVLDNIVNDTGPAVVPDDIDSVTDYGGFPTLTDTGEYTDTSGDGIPDVWATANGLNPSLQYHDVDSGNGYTWLERFLDADPPNPVEQPPAPSPARNVMAVPGGLGRGGRGQGRARGRR
jgi:hypothetical protein